MRELSAHSLRCLGALAGLIEAHDRKETLWRRWDIGRIVYGHTQGVQLRSMQTLYAAGLVTPETDVAIALVMREVCRCGCDRWTITEAGRAELERRNVKVPQFKSRRQRRTGATLTEYDVLDMLDPDPAVQWWKVKPAASSARGGGGRQ